MKKTLFEDVNRQRSLMGLPLITEETQLEEGWATNLGVGVGLTLLSLLPNIAKPQSSVTGGNQGVEIAETSRPITSEELDAMLDQMYNNGWRPQSAEDDIFRYTSKAPGSKLPPAKWMVVNGKGKTPEMAGREVNMLLNTLDTRDEALRKYSPVDALTGAVAKYKTENPKMPRFVLYLQKNDGSWEAMGIIMTERMASLAGNVDEASPAI